MHMFKKKRGHICAALARFRPPWRLFPARMGHLTWLLAQEGHARHFPRRGMEEKSQPGWFPEEHSLRGSVSGSIALYTRISSR